MPAVPYSNAAINRINTVIKVIRLGEKSLAFKSDDSKKSRAELLVPCFDMHYKVKAKT